MEGIERIGLGNIIRVLVIFLLGLAIGWFAIGWWLWPVQYYDTDPQDLRRSHKETWVMMVAESYSLNQNADLAKERLGGFKDKEKQEILGALIRKLEAAGDLPGVQRLRDLSGAAGIAPGTLPVTPTVTVTPTATPAPSGSILQPLGKICGLFLLVSLVIIGVGLGLSKLKARQEGAPSPPREEVMRWAESEVPPLGQFVTTYRLGDDRYDTSFNIETATGEFYGACGVGFSEVLGQGTPEKMTAFEVWLFDKTDPANVQTVTEVLMSDYAYHDKALRERMKDRGEAVLVEKGKAIEIEALGLRLKAEVVDFAYGSSAGLPPNSFFERMTTELTPSLKYEG